MIATHNGIENEVSPININDYHAIKKHLDKYYIQLAKRADRGITPYNLRSCIYMDDFYKQKLVWTPINSEYRFCLIPEDTFINNSLFMITGNCLDVLCGFFNSKLYRFYFDILLSNGNYTYGSREFFKEVPVCNNSSNMKELKLLVDLAISKKEHFKNISDKIDQIVYNFYNLTNEEINYIEEKYK